ncbi:beta-ketoacyl-[acyl-carrier-protein] synthase family protein [Lactiplantibacillus pentosus]|uniref:beta-ketoacyl-[acyl-carrier-protein] synthase family protein n=1 Tax=Lactiplantibacillus pentosus TaxID=1589 RepID=UPI0021A7279F|nr:beta-ketoacyl-[acyl-carrier-protein] synthase family protein [Lactiplantibacillus pentosus]MCT3311098.1 beta-ketoacyl-[acyl-carrier-protein] synthase family protein [Lactiplantibacillus pentosus]
MEKVVVTGMGSISCMGKSVDEMMDNIHKNQVNFSHWEYEPNLVVGSVSSISVNSANRKIFSKLDRVSKFAICAADEALAQAKIERNNSFGENLGIVTGTGLGGIQTVISQAKKIMGSGFESISPLFYPKMLSNMTASAIGILYGAHGVNKTISTACASGTDAIGEAFELIRTGQQDIVCVVGCESDLNPELVGGFKSLRALSKSSYINAASTPFDESRSGFVISEGAAAVVLESEMSARNRNVKIIGSILGYGTCSDAYNLVAPDPNGTYLASAIEKSLNVSGVKKKSIGYINAHGTSTHANDLMESKAFNTVFGEKKVPLTSSTKGFTGHMLGATGVIEVVITLSSMLAGTLPTNIGLSKQDKNCQIPLVNESNRHKKVRFALSTSAAFGGINSSLVLGLA